MEDVKVSSSRIKEDSFELLKELILPGYESGKDLCKYVGRVLRQNIDSQGYYEFEEIVKLCKEYISENSSLVEIRDSLNGKKPLDYQLHSYVNFLIGVTNCFPYDAVVPDSKYEEIHEKLFGKKSDSNIGPAGKERVKRELEERLLDGR